MKFPCGGGEGAVHSSVVASHGLSFTFSPCLMLQKKLMMNGIWASPIVHAAQEIGLFHSNPVHPWPPSYQRRCIPAMPCKNIGRKIAFMQISVGQKCTFPQNSLIFRPVAFGNQK